MFFKLASRNSKRSRKENSLFFSSLLISIVVFYVVLSLPRQDVMIFLEKMESDAVDRLMSLLPVFFCVTLLILFFLIYYAGKLYLECRRHEFGVYLMLGMRRHKLFAMLILEDFKSSAAALLAGIPSAVLLSELISLITARLVGIGIIGHRVSFSPEAALKAALGFLLVKFAAFLILSGNISKQEIGALLADMPEGGRKQPSLPVCRISLSLGGLLLLAGCALAVSGRAWQNIASMGATLFSGIFGMFLFFYGLRLFIGKMAKRKRQGGRIHVFNFRQIEETVICRSHTLAVCALLILAAMCCFGMGMGTACFYHNFERHVLDYTFLPDRPEGAGHAGTAEGYDFLPDETEDVRYVREILEENGLKEQFSRIFEMRVGHIQSEEGKEIFSKDAVLDALKRLPDSHDKDVLLNNLGYEDFPYLISLSGYNGLLKAAGLPELALLDREAAVYMDSEYAPEGRRKQMNQILSDKPEVFLNGEGLRLTGEVQTMNLVTDRSITLSFALILSDEQFSYYTRGEYDRYVNGVLDEKVTEEKSLMQAISDMNRKLDRAGIVYESYLQNMGRQLFYMVAACYLTLYLAIVFLIVANTMIGVQFLMGQQKSGRRYRTLVCLGATYDVLYRSVKSQIHWYFGIPTVIAGFCSLFGVRSLFLGLFANQASERGMEIMIVSGCMIFLICVVEWIYIFTVKKAGCRYLLTLMEPERV